MKINRRPLFPLLFSSALLLGATPAFAQDPPGETLPSTAEKDAEEPDPPPSGPKSPREVFKKFFEYMGRYNDSKDPEDLHRAGRLFELDDVLKGDQEYVADSAARDLLNFLDRAQRSFPVGIVPGETFDESIYGREVAHRTVDGAIEHANIEVTRGSSGIWRFSKETRKQANELFQKVAHMEPRHGKGGVTDSTTWIRDNVPVWMHGRIFLLDHWQWIGLLALILIGILASVLARLLTMAIRAYVLNRRGMKAQSRGWRRSRPFGLMAMATAWFFCLGFLNLPEQSYSALMLVVRLVLMVGTTWAVCSLIEYVAEVLSHLALRTDTRIDDVVVPMVQRALKILVVALGIVWIADNMDMDVAALLAGLSIGGLALALAARDTVENFFGTVSILADRPFEVGDWIDTEGVEGTVESVGFRSTRIRTFYNSLITLPNALLTRAKVDNLGARRYRRIRETLGVTYDTPADKLEAFVEGIRELIRRHPYTRKDYFHVYFHSYGDSSLNIMLYLFLETPDWATELRERQRLLMDILRLSTELGVEFAFPTRTLHMVQGENPAHGDGFPDVDQAQLAGRSAAAGIVDRFTGKSMPPPVVQSPSARDDAADGVGEGE